MIRRLREDLLSQKKQDQLYTVSTLDPTYTKLSLLEGKKAIDEPE